MWSRPMRSTRWSCTRSAPIRTAQSYHGDMIVEECFWIYGFEELFKVASAMATQSRPEVTKHGVSFVVMRCPNR